MDVILGRFLLTFLSLSLQYTAVNAYPSLQEVIPNGGDLPHPCKLNYIWHGVGHLHDRGGGKLNQFGKDFLRFGKKWSRSICQLDSDGDGKTNGEELGDPDCMWTPGKLPLLINITHPGVCDPFDNEKCRKKNEWVDCSTDELKCEATTEEDVKNVTLQMEETKVPEVETSYMCTMFDLPTDGDYHMIANKPYIDNEYVMHHMLLYGCPDNEKIRKIPAGKTSLCPFNNLGCREIIGLWTVGSAGECAPKIYGVRMGPSGYKRAVLQVHWHNPEFRNTYVDSSGLILYYTKKLRPNDAAIMGVGNVHFELPPNRPEVNVVGTCTEKCSKQKFKKPIFVSSAMNHMHYLGIKQKTEVIRNGIKITELTNEDDYNYDSPKVKRFDNAVEIRPGDEIKTTCVYKTKSRVNSTFFGRGSKDEMCFAFLTFYPTQNVKSTDCATYGTLSFCDLHKSVLHDCHVKNFGNVSYPEFVDMRQSVQDHCRNYTCSEKCRSHIKAIRKHPCMKGDVGDLLHLRLSMQRNEDITDFYKALDSCPLSFKALESSSQKLSVSNFVFMTVVISVSFSRSAEL